MPNMNNVVFTTSFDKLTRALMLCSPFYNYTMDIFYDMAIYMMHKTPVLVAKRNLADNGASWNFNFIWDKIYEH